jgi:hypothetical protein
VTIPLFPPPRIYPGEGNSVAPRSRSPAPIFASDTHNAVKQRGASCRLTVFPPPKGRRCRRCTEFLPFSVFRPNLRLSSGWNSWCRACCVEATRAWRERNRERVNAARRTPPTKLRCAECGTEFEGRKSRLLCGRRRCKDRRYARLHPEEMRAKQQRKYQRRKAA